MSKRPRQEVSDTDQETADDLHIDPSTQIAEDEASLSEEESEFSELSSELDTEPEEQEDEQDFGGEGEGGIDGEIDGEKLVKSWLEAEETDTSDEEEVRNTVGNIPLEWYSDYPHLGYDLDGRTVSKPAKRDELEEYLAKMEDPAYWRTVRDKATGREVVLTEQQMKLVQRLQSSQFPEEDYNQYEPYVDFFSGEKMVHPLNDTVKPKSSFIPSRWEAKQVSRLVHAIRMGWLKPRTKPERPKFYMLWGEGEQTDVSGARHHMHIPAPKPPLPGHSESYNPPPEFLPTPTEVNQWEEEEEGERPSFLPRKYSSLREVPGYSRFIQERFERCLDLYLCPRQRKMRVQVDPDDLIPKLPKPQDLQPYPTTETIVYEGHAGTVRCVDIEPLGQWMASGSEDSSVRVWEVVTGRCVKTLPLPSPPHSLSFSPSHSLTLMAVAAGGVVYIINHGLGDRLLVASTDSRLSTFSPSTAEATPTTVTWEECTEVEKRSGVRVCIKHKKPVKEVVWHSKGDYLATIMMEESRSAVLIHQLSKRRSQKPFRSIKGAIQRVKFHPTRPLFFVATQTMVKVFDLARQELVKRLQAGVKWVSSIDIHPGGDNLILGGYDKRVCWFDLDLSSKPYRVIRQHKQAVRGVRFHARLPLFASCSDDACITVCHGMVYDDLMENPLIVPVKVLRGHRPVNSLGVLELVFHPHQPWLISAGADSTLRLFT